MGLKNVELMVPFCRTPDEGKKVIDILNANGLKKGKDGLKVWVMCELPSNVFAIDEFAKVFDGFSVSQYSSRPVLSYLVWTFLSALKLYSYIITDRIE